jgi:hypothetical protein
MRLRKLRKRLGLGTSCEIPAVDPRVVSISICVLSCLSCYDAQVMVCVVT